MTKSSGSSGCAVPTSDVGAGLTPPVLVGKEEGRLTSGASAPRAATVVPSAPSRGRPEWAVGMAGKIDRSGAAVARGMTLPAEFTRFVGRRRELAEVKRLLSGSRLVTLTGIGGVGKTRLSLRAAADLSRAFRDGVHPGSAVAVEVVLDRPARGACLRRPEGVATFGSPSRRTSVGRVASLYGSMGRHRISRIRSASRWPPA
jgi:hypothetical protein